MDNRIIDLFIGNQTAASLPLGCCSHGQVGECHVWIHRWIFKGQNLSKFVHFLVFRGNVFQFWAATSGNLSIIWLFQVKIGRNIGSNVEICQFFSEKGQNLSQFLFLMSKFLSFKVKKVQICPNFCCFRSKYWFWSRNFGFNVEICQFLSKKGQNLSQFLFLMSKFVNNFLFHVQIFQFEGKKSANLSKFLLFQVKILVLKSKFWF